MKFNGILLFLVMVANVTFATVTGLDTWTSNDFKNFLKDRKVKFNSDSSYEDLKDLANAEYDKLKSNSKVKVDVSDKKQQPILNLATDPKATLNELLPFHNWDYLTGDDNKSESELKNWIFESWNKPTLEKFLKSNKISYKSNDTKKELIEKAKKNWDKITKTNEVSGSYPGDWLFSEWNEKDLKEWLSSYEVPFDAKAKKDELIENVKKNSRSASLSIKDTVNSVLESLDVFEKDLFDKKDNLKDDFFEGWSYSQLREWLYYAGIIEEKPGVYSKNLTPEKLKKIAQKNKAYFVHDVKGYTDKAKEYASPFLSKEPASSKVTSDVINDTFLVSVDKWSKDRLRDFLKARDVHFSPFSTKKQLVELVKQNKSLPVKVKEVVNSWVTSALDVDQYSDLLKNKGYETKEKPQEIGSFISEYFRSSPSDTFATRTALYKPTLEEYKKYVASQFSKADKNVKQPSEKSIKHVFSVVSEYYDQATSSIGSTLGDFKFNVDESLNEAEKAAYEYSLSFLNDYEARKSQANREIESAKIAASSFATNLSSRLAKNYKSTQSSVEHYFNFLAEYLVSFKGHLIELFNHVTNRVADTNKNVKSQVDSYSASGKEAYDEYKGEVGQKAEEAYSSSKEFVDHAAANAEKTYSDVHEAAVNYGSSVGESVKNTYDALGSKVTEVWDSALRLYTNADLKAYLSTFGFDPNSLDHLSRYQLFTLARMQTDVYWGGNKNKWTRSISEIYSDLSDDVLSALGLKSEKKSVWSNLRL